jgi:hypothetical protein
MPLENDSLRQFQIEIARVLTQSKTTPVDNERMKLNTSELEQSRETLIRKRISQTRYLLPRTASAMGTPFNHLFREFAMKHHFNGSNAIAMDAIAFSTWLNRSKNASPWIRQLAMWESMDCHWSLGKIHIKFYRFQYDFQRPFGVGIPNKRNSCWCCFRVFAYSKKIELFGGDRLR